MSLTSCSRPGAAPWLSVLIPAFNVKDYLRECVASVLAQAEEGVEVILADDCSTDGTADLIRALVAEHAQGAVPVRALLQGSNRGPSVSRNAMLAEARGEYIWFLDSDDRMVPGAMARLKAVVEQHGPALVMCDFAMLRQTMKRKHKRRGELHRHTFIGPARQILCDPSVLIRGMFEAGHLHVWSKIARRSVWNEGGASAGEAALRFPVDRYFEDVTVSPLLVLRAGGVWYEPEVWIEYRQREGSILATPNMVKADHQAHALLPLKEQAAGLPLDAEARFAWGRFVACTFISVCRSAEKAQPGRSADLHALFHHAFETSLPLPAGALLRGYVQRGWWLRALRLRYWMRRAQTAQTARAVRAGAKAGRAPAIFRDSGFA